MDINRPLPGYEPEYRMAAKKTEIYYQHALSDEKHRGMLNGKTAKEVVELYNSIKPCKCGGKPECLQLEGMGEFDFSIKCQSCGRVIWRNMYDQLPWEAEDEIDRCVADWNAGREQEDIKQEYEAEYERIRIHEEDIVWKPYYANNMLSNPLEGYYSLMFIERNGKYYGCKWTIEFQEKETEPMWISSNAEVEAYILFMKRMFDIEKMFDYPDPEKDADDVYGDAPVHFGEHGDFVRAYKTLEEAKKGAAARCGWQGINRDTLIR